MSDSRLRALERKADAGDPQALAQWLHEQQRLSTWDKTYRNLALKTPYSQAVLRHNFPVNHFCAGDDEDLGETVKVIFFGWRAAAIQITEDGKRESFDVDSDLFEELEQLHRRNTKGVMTGPQFLVWCPAIKETLSWFCWTKSLKRTLSKFRPTSRKLLGQTKILYAEHIQSRRHEWWTIGIRDE